MDVVGICNQALGWVGETPIAALDDATRKAELCNENFGPARDAVLEARAWTFAVERRELAADATAPAFGYSTRYQVPSDVLRVLACDDGSGAWDMTWEREGAYLLCDVASTLRVRVVLRSEDPTKWSPAFCEALAYKLAGLLVIPLAADAALQERLAALYEHCLQRAGRLDGRQGSAEQVVRAGNLRAARE